MIRFQILWIAVLCVQPVECPLVLPREEPAFPVTQTHTGPGREATWAGTTCGAPGEHHVTCATVARVQSTGWAQGAWNSSCQAKGQTSPWGGQGLQGLGREGGWHTLHHILARWGVRWYLVAVAPFPSVTFLWGTWGSFGPQFFAFGAENLKPPVSSGLEVAGLRSSFA